MGQNGGMDLREIIERHDQAEPWATVQRLVDHAAAYKLLFGYLHQWIFPDGRVRGVESTGRQMQVTWFPDGGEPGGFHCETGGRAREPGTGPDLYMANMFEVQEAAGPDASEGTVFRLYSNGIRSGHDAMFYASDRMQLEDRMQELVYGINLRRAALSLGMADVETLTSHDPRWRPTRDEELQCLDWLIEEGRAQLREMDDPAQPGLWA